MKVSVVIPAHNEKENIRLCVQRLVQLRHTTCWDCQIIIVDDHSEDGTRQIADRLSNEYENIIVLHRKTGKRGMGLALIQGTRIAKGEIIIWVMADCADDISIIPTIVDKIHAGDDMVFASRYMIGGSIGNMGWVKAFLSRWFTIIARYVLGFNVHDITNAFRGFRKSMFESMHLESGDFTISPEFAIKAKLLNFRLGEIPTTYSQRVAGKTKFGIIRMCLKYTKLMILLAWRRK